MRTARVIVMLITAGLVATACGGRTSSSPPASTPPTTTATTPATTVASNPNCPTSGTDVGLTSSTINLGTIADVTGPVPGLFTGAQQGINAFAAYINANGGLCGHTVHIDFLDGATSCATNENDVNTLIKKDFALVGTFSLYDGCGETILKQNSTVPDVHVALDPTAATIPNHFDMEPGSLGYANGMWKYFANKLGQADITNAGTITSNIPSAVQKQGAQIKAANSAGWKITYNGLVSPTTGDFTSEFQKMCGQKHVKVFYTTTADAQNAATMISDENQVAACKGLINIIPVAYDQAFLTFCKQLGCGANANTVQGWNEYSLFFNTNEAANLPELKLFQTWFEKTNPGKPLNLYALFAWVDGRMFQKAFENAGSTANRQTVLAALNKIHHYSDGGIMAPANPNSKTTGNTCYLIWKLNNGVFSRQTPAKGYRCDGSYVRS